MPILIKSPRNYKNEREYIYNVILGHFFGLEYKIIFEDRNNIEISEGECLKKIYIEDVFFETPPNSWLKKASLPNRPLDKLIIDDDLNNKIINLNSEIPIIYGRKTEKGNYLSISAEKISLGIDIFGSAFFMFTRYEEYIKSDVDKLERFPATASLSYQEGFLERPIINEYLELLWFCLKELKPQLERKKRRSRTIVSHDVDVPFYHAFNRFSLKQHIRILGGDVVKRKSLFLASQRLKSMYSVKKGEYRKDINYTFDRIMDLSDKRGLKNAFYFKTACTNPTYDDPYPIEHPWVRQLLKDIYNRGHEIGIHPSFNTFQDRKQSKLEFERLLKVCEEEGIKQTKWGGRQHYLRWSAPNTWRNWEDAGLDYDSTLSYADHAGFRCGICYEFPVFDLEHRKQLVLIERPLIVMEGSVLGEKYMNLNNEDALQYILKLKERCKMFNGDFTLLWHNCSLVQRSHWELYSKLL